MNILFLDQFSDLGGAQLCLLDLLPAIRDEGWNAVVAAPGEGQLFARCEAAGVSTHRLEIGPYHSARKTIGDMARFVRDVPRTAATIRSLVSMHRIDLLYINGPRLMPAVRRGLPVIFHCHSYIGQAYLRTLVDTAIRYSRARVIACCKFVAEPFGDRLPVVIYNGVADCARPRLMSQRPRIGIIGRISPEKGQAEFLRAARCLPDCDFVVCGAPSDLQYDRSLRALVEGLPVEFTGWRDDVAEVLASLDLLVVPSQPTEATTRVIPEAFSAGVPVVARRGGGISEVVRDGENGYLVDSLEPTVLAAACAKALQAQKIREQARRTFEQQFTLPRYRAAVLDIIRRTATEAQKHHRGQ